MIERTGSDSAGNIAQQPADQQQSAASLIEDSQGGDMEVNVPTDLNDRHIVQLRAAVTRAKKELDSLVNDIKEQVSVIGTAQVKDTPAATVLSYKRDLKSLLDDGDLLTKRLIDKNGSLTERLEMLTYTAPEGSDLLSKTTSLRDRLFGEEPPYRGMFRKLRVEHESLLTGLGESGTTSTSAVSAIPRSRKEYEYLKPSLLNIVVAKKIYKNL